MFDLMPFGRRNDWLRSLESMEKDMLSDFGGSMSTFQTDVLDKGDRYVIESELPGFEKKDINIDIENGYLTVRAEHKEETEKKEEGRYLRRERHYGSFSRSFDLSDIQEDQIKASYDNGLLTLTLPKKAPTSKPTSRRIELE